MWHVDVEVAEFSSGYGRCMWWWTDVGDACLAFPVCLPRTLPLSHSDPHDRFCNVAALERSSLNSPPSHPFNLGQGAMLVDQEVYAELRATGTFEEMDIDVDEVGTKPRLDQPKPKTIAA